jgi:hypothetical protein
LFCLGAPGARSQDSQRGGSPSSEALPAYPETTDGAKKLVQDMIDALTSENDGKLAAYVSGLTIPDHAAWFSKAFGAEEGARLDAKYADVLARVASKLRQRLNYALDGQMSDVSASVLQKPAANTGERLDRAIFEALAQPVTIYLAQ